MRSELVKSVEIGKIVAAPNSVAFSTMKSVRAFLMGANNSQTSGGSCSALVLYAFKGGGFLVACLYFGLPFAIFAVKDQNGIPNR